MKNKIYRTLAITIVLVCVIMAAFIWYVVGVVEKNKNMQILESRVEYISDVLYKKEFKRESIPYQMFSEYKSRVRALSMLLLKNPDIISDELQIEELQTSIGADVISVYDENLQLEFSTDFSMDNDIDLNSFKPALTNKLFSLARLDISSEQPKIIVGCSRLDEDGIVIVEYHSDNIETFFNLLDISDIFTGVPVMMTGEIALIDNKTMNYTAHTNEEMIGKPSHFNLKEDFFVADSFIDCELNGEDVLLYFDICNNETIIGYIPYSEIYGTRNDIILWVVVAALVISGVMILVVRGKILHIRNKKKKIATS